MFTPVLFQLPDRNDIKKVQIKSLFEEPILSTG